MTHRRQEPFLQGANAAVPLDLITAAHTAAPEASLVTEERGLDYASGMASAATAGAARAALTTPTVTALAALAGAMASVITPMHATQAIVANAVAADVDPVALAPAVTRALAPLEKRPTTSLPTQAANTLARAASLPSHAAVTSRVDRLPVSPQPMAPLLVVYAFVNSTSASGDNLRFFIKHGMQPHPNVDHKVIVQLGGLTPGACTTMSGRDRQIWLSARVSSP